LAVADNEKEPEKKTCCEYAKVVSGLGDFQLSIRECGNQTCPESIFSESKIYEKCQYRLQYIKDGVSADQIVPRKVFVRIRSKQEAVPKFTSASCNGCQYKSGSYCWGQCTINVWKKKHDW
jgi:hypothetical protein